MWPAAAVSSGSADLRRRLDLGLGGGDRDSATLPWLVASAWSTLRATTTMWSAMGTAETNS